MSLKGAIETIEDGLDVLGTLLGGKFGQVEHEVVAVARGVTGALQDLAAGKLTLEQARAAIADAKSKFHADLAAGDGRADEAAKRLPEGSP